MRHQTLSEFTAKIEATRKARLLMIAVEVEENEASERRDVGREIGQTDYEWLQKLVAPFISESA